MSEQPRMVAQYSAWLKAVRERLDELDITHDTVDDVAGLPLRYTAKILAGIKIASIHTFFNINAALALDNALLPNPEVLLQLQRRSKWLRRKYKRPMRSGAKQKPTRLIISPGFMREIASRGGLARVRNTTKAQRREQARHAANARWRSKVVRTEAGMR